MFLLCLLDIGGAPYISYKFKHPKASLYGKRNYRVLIRVCVCVCVCVSVFVCVCFCTITQKEIDLGTRNRNTL